MASVELGPSHTIVEYLLTDTEEHPADPLHEDSKILAIAAANFCDHTLTPLHPTRTTKALVITGALTALTFAAIPAQLPVCIKIVQGNRALEYALGAGSILGNFRNTSKPFSAKKMADSVILTLASAENVGSAKHSRLTRIMRIAGGVICGAGAQIPALFMLFQLGESTGLALSTIPEAILPMYSSYLALRVPLCLRGSGKPARLASFQADIVHRMRHFLKGYIQGTGLEATESFFTHLQARTDSHSLKARDLFNHLIANDEPTSTVDCAIIAKRSIAWPLGLLLTLAQMYYTFIPTEVGLEMTINDKVALYTLATFTCLANVALLQTLLFATSYQAVEGLTNWGNRQGREIYIGERLAPLASRVLKTGSQALCAAVGWTASAAVSRTYLEDPQTQLLSTVVLGTSQIFMSYKVLRLFSEWGLEAWIAYRGSEKDKKQLTTYRDIAEFVDFVAASSPASLAKFLLSIGSTSLTSRLLAKHRLTWTDLSLS